MSGHSRLRFEQLRALFVRYEAWIELSDRGGEKCLVE